jgi:F420-non-reducing hydrogenase iron-sulfur subunit
MKIAHLVQQTEKGLGLDWAQMGLEPERLEMFNVGSAGGPKFAAICRKMSGRAHNLGPSPINREARAA